jgi:hypothetical protein
MENKNITWTASEFKAHRKNYLWYVVFVLITLALIAYGIYIRNVISVITFVLLSIVTFFMSRQKPREITYMLSSTGITIGESNFPYRSIKKFWIIYTPENKTANFETTAYLNNQITMQLGSQDPLIVKQFLKAYLSEDLDKEESVTDVLARKFKF